MPITQCKNPRYRFRTLESGEQQRIAFCNDKVVEVTTWRDNKKKTKYL